MVQDSSATSTRRSRSTLAGVLVLCSINCVLWFLASLLAVTGDGSADGIIQLWLIGYPLIALATFAAIWCRNRGRSGVALFVAALPLPMVYLVIVVGSKVAAAFAHYRADSPEMQRACRSAGVNYIARPAAPVRSVAYDWDAGSHAPQDNYFTMDERRNVGRRQGGSGAERFPAQIEFIESRCCRYTGQALTRSGRLHPKTERWGRSITSPSRRSPQTL